MVLVLATLQELLPRRQRRRDDDALSLIRISLHDLLTHVNVLLLWSLFQWSDTRNNYFSPDE